jgi:hypothetical protein
MDPARFHGQVWPRVDVPLHAPRVGVRNTFDFGGSHRVKPGQKTMNTTQTMTISMKISR